MTELEIAKKIAFEAHEGVHRKYSGMPYWTHPEYVAALLPDINDKIVGWLHDVLEDNKEWTYDRLVTAGISPDNALDVLRLTKLPKEGYFGFISRIKSGASERAIRVKIADLTHNLSDLHKYNLTPVWKQKRETYLLARELLKAELCQRQQTKS